ncbi:MAG TPA: tetratricopeptide repeat protein [Gaiellaceae bacterium]
MTDDLPELEAFAVWDERLRQVARPADADAMADAAARAETLAAEAAEAGTRRDLLAYAGAAYRMLGRGDDAVRCLRGALELAGGDPDARAEVVALIRLGEAERCRDRFTEAEALLRAALDRARRVGSHEDFALQHLGKCLVDAGEADEAVPVLERALALRLERGDAALVDSTRRALALALRARARTAAS